jgi:hypothetical protein
MVSIIQFKQTAAARIQIGSLEISVVRRTYRIQKLAAKIRITIPGISNYIFCGLSF